MNAKHKNNKLNRTLQNFMYTMLMTETSQAGHNDKNSSSEHVIAGKKSLEVCIELYQKNIWNDHKTVNVIAEACLSPITKVMVTAVHFFLGNNEQKEESDDEEDIDLRKLDHQSTINKKTKSRSKKREKALAKMKRKERKSNQAETFNFSALHLIHDPQGFAEKLFSRLGKATNEGFPVRLSLMKLIARVVGVHKLMLLGFYPYLMRYLQPSQKDVTQVLALTAQACHELVPPDVVEPCIMAIANNFVTQNMSNEVMAAGINGIREICHRTPLAMSSALLQDLTEYKGTRDKGVMMAARSLIGLFREINPELLKRKDRGRSAAMKLNAEGSTALQFGEVKASSFIEGTELLDDDEFEKLNGEAEGSDEDDEVDSDDEDIPDLVDGEDEDEVLELGSGNYQLSY
jgi:protein SDA1